MRRPAFGGWSVAIRTWARSSTSRTGSCRAPIAPTTSSSVSESGGAQGAGANTLDLHEVAEEALAFVRHEIESRGIAWSINAVPGLPMVLGDRVQLQQVIVNLLVNSIQAISQGTGRTDGSASPSRPSTATRSSSRSAIPAPVSPTKRWDVSSRVSSRPNRAASASASRSASPSSDRMEGTSGPSTSPGVGRTFSSALPAHPGRDGRSESRDAGAGLMSDDVGGRRPAG